MQRNTGLILALDLTDRERALEVAKAARPHVDALKVGYPLVLSAGLGVVKDLAAIAPVICDFKIADIPLISTRIATLAFDAGASGVIVHGFAGSDTVKAVIDLKRGDVFVLAEMSHPGGKEFTATNADDFAHLASQVGATGIIAPATRPDRIEMLRRASGNLLVLSPGVGPQGGKPADAIHAGADFVIVGRAIAEAPDPGASAARIVEEIRRAQPSKK